MMGRIWIVALAMILARFAGGKDDGIMAAALVLAAFTVYFVMSFFTRESPLAGSARRRRPEAPEHLMSRRGRRGESRRPAAARAARAIERGHRGRATLEPPKKQHRRRSC